MNGVDSSLRDDFAVRIAPAAPAAADSGQSQNQTA
jgi:hypothetical protein